MNTTLNGIYKSREAMHRAIWAAGFRLDAEVVILEATHQIWTNSAGQYIRVCIGTDGVVIETRHVRFIGDAAIHAPGFRWSYPED